MNRNFAANVVVVFAIFFSFTVVMRWVEKSLKHHFQPTTVAAASMAPILQPAARFNVDELIPCVNKLGGGGWEVSRDTKTEVVMRFVVVSPGIELRLEKGVEVLGARIVTNAGKDLGWKERTFSPGEIHFLGESDFYSARDKVLAECQRRGMLK